MTTYVLLSKSENDVTNHLKVTLYTFFCFSATGFNSRWCFQRLHI